MNRGSNLIQHYIQLIEKNTTKSWSTESCWSRHHSKLSAQQLVSRGIFTIFYLNISFGCRLLLICFVSLTIQIVFGKGRGISIITVPSAKRWQDVVLGRMKWATITIDKQVDSWAHRICWVFFILVTEPDTSKFLPHNILSTHKLVKIWTSLFFWITSPREWRVMSTLTEFF